MNKEEFITRVNTLNWTIRVTEKEKSALKEKYIADSCPYKVGDKVKIARVEGRKNASNKPTYVSVQGKVVGINGDKLSFARRRWSVQLDKEWASINGVPEVSFYTFLGGVFKKDTAPKVGDLVTLRCRITKMCPKFSRYNARISEIVKNNG